MAGDIILVEKLTKVFPNKHVALDNINLEVQKGQIFGFIGPNGAGKTTTIKILLGLMQPTSGRAILFNKEVDKNRVDLLQKVGYLPESSNLYPKMTVEEILNFGRSIYKDWDLDLQEKYLRLFGLRKSDYVKNLSKGMNTQLGLISAMSYRPEILILDEPTSGLDPLWRHEFLQIIIGEIAQWGTTVFFSSHILSEVERMADKVAMIRDGKVVLQRDLDELKLNEKIIRVVFENNVDESFLNLTKGITKITPQGKGYVIKINDNFEAIHKKISSIPHHILEVVERNLEEVFMDYAQRGGSEDA